MKKNLSIIKEIFTKVVAFDVDDTLILHDQPKDPKNSRIITLKHPADGADVSVWVHEEHVKLLKDQFALGRTILVWSHGGGEWVNAVVDALELENFVHLKMSKPMAFVDDLDCVHWLNKRVWVGQEPRLGSNPEKGLQNLNDLDEWDIF